MEIDDVDGCELLSILHMDRALRDVSVVTCATGPTIRPQVCRNLKSDTSPAPRRQLLIPASRPVAEIASYEADVIFVLAVPATAFKV